MRLGETGLLGQLKFNLNSHVVQQRDKKRIKSKARNVLIKLGKLSGNSRALQDV